MSESNPRKSPYPAADPFVDQNVQKMAVVMKSEAPDRAAQVMVGWTLINRMRRRGTPPVASVIGSDYSIRQPATSQTLDLARQLLSGELPDNSQGVTHFYTPAVMPREGEPTHGFDVGGHLEQVRGVKGKNGKPARNYKPGFTNSMIRVQKPSIPESEFKFFR